MPVAPMWLDADLDKFSLGVEAMKGSGVVGLAGLTEHSFFSQPQAYPNGHGPQSSPRQDVAGSPVSQHDARDLNGQENPKQRQSVHDGVSDSLTIESVSCLRNENSPDKSASTKPSHARPTRGQFTPMDTSGATRSQVQGATSRSHDSEKQRGCVARRRKRPPQARGTLSTALLCTETSQVLTSLAMDYLIATPLPFTNRPCLPTIHAHWRRSGEPQSPDTASPGSLLHAHTSSEGGTSMPERLISLQLLRAQLSADGVLVVHPSLTVAGLPFDIGVHSLPAAALMQMAIGASSSASSSTGSTESPTRSLVDELKRSRPDGVYTMVEVVLPSNRTHTCMPPEQMAAEHRPGAACLSAPDLNDLADAVCLAAVEAGDRSPIALVSSDPDVCTLLALKQNTLPVFCRIPNDARYPCSHDSGSHAHTQEQRQTTSTTKDQVARHTSHALPFLDSPEVSSLLSATKQDPEERHPPAKTCCDRADPRVVSVDAVASFARSVGLRGVIVDARDVCGTTPALGVAARAAVRNEGLALISYLSADDTEVSKVTHSQTRHTRNETLRDDADYEEGNIQSESAMERFANAIADMESDGVLDARGNGALSESIFGPTECDRHDACATDEEMDMAMHSTSSGESLVGDRHATVARNKSVSWDNPVAHAGETSRDELHR